MPPARPWTAQCQKYERLIACPWTSASRSAHAADVSPCVGSVAQPCDVSWPKRCYQQSHPTHTGDIVTIKGKTAIVTGSTSGIGLGIARTLGGAGANLVLNGFGDAAQIEALRLDL